MESDAVIFDISPLVSDRTAVFPGDTPFSRNLAMDMKNGDHLTLSSMTTTMHIGSHADAPSHYLCKGVGIEKRSLAPYLGLCQVIKVKASGEQGRILPEDLDSEVNAPRVIFRTDTFPDPEVWVDDFASLSPELIEFLVSKDVKLVGIDTPSIDPSNCKDLLSHQAVARCDLSILEGLCLHNVPSGIFELIALPLKIENADASPVRAILRKTAKS